MLTRSQNLSIALAWCLAYSDPQVKKDIEKKGIAPLRKALEKGYDLPKAWQAVWGAIEKFNQFSSEIPDSPSTIAEYSTQHHLNYKIGLIYGGATKIKQYVFETENLQDIRGASAILDQINLQDLPAFFNPNDKSPVKTWLNRHFPELKAALIPELIIYSTGGNILALCPAPYINQLTDAIERYYTETTLTANSCAVGDTFQLLEFKFGLLSDPIETTPWLDHYQHIHNLESSTSTTTDPKAQFQQRKNFNELVTHLTSQFNHRRNGNLTDQRSHRRYPPMYETHPYIQRDDSGLRSTIDRITQLPSQPKFSEATARKRLVGQLTKREVTGEWIRPLSPQWQPSTVSSWVNQFLNYLDADDSLKRQYFKQGIRDISEARSLPEIGQASEVRGYVAYIYADGNNMGQYIQREIRSPEAYQEFSEDIFRATQHAVYRALAQHLNPTEIQRETTPGQASTIHIHPFEIIAIGGDDVFLVVPADQALAIAKSIGEEFENILLAVGGDRYKEDTTYEPAKVHRCKESAPRPQSKLSLSTGALIAAENIPVYYAQKLVEQLLKSAKKRAKLLKKNHYLGGTVDFLIMKSVTMVSSDLDEFRQQARTKVSSNQKQILKLYGAPYTLHELGTLLNTSRAIKQSKFPKNQLYQIRSFLEQGKQTAMLNYRYFQARLSGNNTDILKESFDNTWCQARSNDGNIAPWISRLTTEDSDLTIPEASITPSPQQKSTYETIWWDLVDLYPFTSDPQQPANIPPPSARNIPRPIPTQKGQFKPKNTPSKYS